MDVNTFYALFSATCFTLLGLWWGVAEKRPGWLRDPARRRDVGGVYLSFLLPALMGLFAQIGGANPLFWRASFVTIALFGAWSTARLLRAAAAEPSVGSLAWARRGALLGYAVIAVIGVVPEITGPLGLRPIQAEAILLVLLIALAHAMVWTFLAHPEDGPA